MFSGTAVLSQLLGSKLALLKFIIIIDFVALKTKSIVDLTHLTSLVNKIYSNSLLYYKFSIAITEGVKI